MYWQIVRANNSIGIVPTQNPTEMNIIFQLERVREREKKSNQILLTRFTSNDFELSAIFCFHLSFDLFIVFRSLSLSLSLSLPVCDLWKFFTLRTSLNFIQVLPFTLRD